MTMRELVESTRRLAAESERSKRSVDLLRQQLIANTIHLERILGGAGGGDVGELLQVLRRSDSELEQSIESLDRTRVSAVSYISHLEQLGG